MENQALRTMSVPAAGRVYFGVCPDTSYRYAKKGIIPTIKVGPKLLRVPVAAMEQKFSGLTVPDSPEAGR